MFNHIAYSAIVWPNVPCTKLSPCLLLIADMWYGTHAWDRGAGTKLTWT